MHVHVCGIRTYIHTHTHTYTHACMQANMHTCWYIVGMLQDVWVVRLWGTGITSMLTLNSETLNPKSPNFAGIRLPKTQTVLGPATSRRVYVDVFMCCGLGFV